ncbi:hypothetical protein [uncultured Sphingomonas sp.]|jgi:hypothetical protein|uniref:hypothetical protein n=1 Tax=uncultured Sphingomonas sp. TaxID=158754 RepID=UPI002618FD92|nr:hypothetical protein [uncultured Sphingomonas sp.]
MSRKAVAVLPAAPRKTLLEWIEFDDGDATRSPGPACDPQAQALHLKILIDPASQHGEPAEPLQSPNGLRLPPLG